MLQQEIFPFMQEGKHPEEEDELEVDGVTHSGIPPSHTN